jgi:hypothetical protein
MRRAIAVLISVLFASAVLAGEGRAPAMVLHATHALSDADVADLESRGISVIRALSNGRYVARVKTESAARNDARIASADAITSRMKLHSSVLREAARAKPFTNVNVIFHDDVAFDAARQAILEVGGELDDVLRVKFAPSQRLTVRVPSTALQSLAANDQVMMIVGATRRLPRTENIESARVAHVNDVQEGLYGLSGLGVNVSLFELAEAQASHVEFGGRLTVNAVGGSFSDKAHATHVAGTIGAAGELPEAKGVAPKARIHQFCVAFSGNQCQGDWIELKDEMLAPLGITADNNSWGYELGWYPSGGFPVWDGSDIYFGSYLPDFGGPFVDQISIDRKVLFVHSAGNSGDDGEFSTEYSQHRHVDNDGDIITSEVFCYSLNDSGTDCPALCNGTNPETHAPAGCEKIAERHHVQAPFDTIGAVASAKNVIAVGAVQGIAGDVRIAALSSRGPAKDGRVKPDVVARGIDVLSPVPTSSYGRKNGTSMASPVVTGIAVLLTEQWRKTFAGANPLPAQLKALILAGADDLGNPGPDYTYGFGLANAKTSVDLILADGGTGSRIRMASFPRGGGPVQTREFPLVVTQPQNLRVLYNWSDPPAAPLPDDEITDPVLVNDLDLKIIDPSGHVHLPYVLDKVAYTANATRGVNRVDNTELVEIANATAGTYRVLITGSNVAVAQDAVVVANASLGAPVPGRRRAAGH